VVVGKMSGAGHVADIVAVNDVCQIFVSKPERKTGSEARLILIAFLEHKSDIRVPPLLYGFFRHLIISSLSSPNIFLSPLHPQFPTILNPFIFLVVRNLISHT
jgi:hypothetical protein